MSNSRYLRVSRLVASFSILLLLGCSDLAGPSGSQGPYALWIGQTGIILAPGDTLRFNAQMMQTNRSLVTGIVNGRWRSDDTTVVRVNINGMVRAVAPGRARVWLDVGTKQDSATVLVRAPEDRPRNRWRHVAVGWNSACALDEQDRAFCWGMNYYGELGNGVRREFTSTLAPVAVDGGHRFRDIDVGERHTCGVNVQGEGLCWGTLGLMGLGFEDERRHARTRPERIPSASRWQQIRTAFVHTCGLDEQGVAYCWGDNRSGQLGIGTHDLGRLAPTRVASDSTFTQIVVSDFLSTCALTQSGSAYCWGNNQQGGLGLGEAGQAVFPRNFTAPQRVVGPDRFVALASRGGHCAQSSEGHTYCWGGRGMGLEGYSWDRNELALYPTRVAADPGYVHVATGGDVICGLLQDRRAECWGIDHEGLLGSGETANEVCGSGSIVRSCTHTPLPVSGGHRFQHLRLSRNFACGVTMDGEIYCWGQNRYGQLGNGTIGGYSAVPVRVADPF